MRALGSAGRVHRLVDHLMATTGLSESEVRRIITDVLSYYSESAEDYVRRRHREMKTYGAKNSAIFATIAAELDGLLVAAPPLSERQLRRIVYG